MSTDSIIGIDMGGTNIRGALVSDFIIKNFHSRKINAQGTSDEVLSEVFSLVDLFFNDSVKAIGIGVPGLVNEEEKMLYDVVYIPSWKKIALQRLVEERYGVPVYINNDSNCFALGEYYFGKGKGVKSMVGLTLGTGLGCGLIIDKRLYAGRNGGAGEFGMISYLDKTIEYYASGQFFKNVYKINGETVFNQAAQGNKDALEMYEAFGFHLGNAIQTILYAVDTELIILGGSVSNAFPYFSEKMWQQIKTFGFQNAIHHLKVETSELENAGVLGAAALYYDKQKNNLT